MECPRCMLLNASVIKDEGGGPVLTLTYCFSTLSHLQFWDYLMAEWARPARMIIRANHQAHQPWWWSWWRRTFSILFFISRGGEKVVLRLFERAHTVKPGPAMAFWSAGVKYQWMMLFSKNNFLLLRSISLSLSLSLRFAWSDPPPMDGCDGGGENHFRLRTCV